MSISVHCLQIFSLSIFIKHLQVKRNRKVYFREKNSFHLSSMYIVCNLNDKNTYVYSLGRLPWTKIHSKATYLLSLKRQNQIKIFLT